MTFALLTLLAGMTANPAPDPSGVAAGVSEAAEPVRPDGEAPWRFELAYGRLRTTSEMNWYTSIPAAGFVRLEVAAPSRPGQWSWRAGIDVSSDSPLYRTYLLSAGITRRAVLVSRWLVADIGAGAGFQFSRYPVAYPLGGGAYDQTTETDGPHLVGHLAGSLAIVRLRLGEIVADVRMEDRPAAWREYWFAISAGVRIALR